MTRDQIIKAMDWHPAAAEHGPQSLLARVERVVQQAIAAEREACAKVADDIAKQYGNGRGGHSAERAANAIRARGQACA